MHRPLIRCSSTPSWPRGSGTRWAACIAAIETLTEIAGKLGVKFIYNSPVAEDQGRESRAVGERRVRPGMGASSSPTLCRQCGSALHLRGPAPQQREATQARQESCTPARRSCSTGVWTSISAARPSQRLPGWRLQGLVRARSSMSTRCPISRVSTSMRRSRTDPAAAPAGQDTLYVLVPVGHLDEAQSRIGRPWSRRPARP